MGLQNQAAFVFLVRPFFCCNLSTLSYLSLSFFFFTHSTSIKCHWHFQPTSLSLIGVLVMCLRQMEVDVP